MNLKLWILIFFSLAIERSSANAVLSLVRTLVQNNIAGEPIVHQHTEWDFHPDDGKKRRVRYEALNGRYGEDLIDRLAQGMDFKGPWGLKVAQPQKDLRYV